MQSWRTPAMVVIAGCLIVIVSFGTRAAFGLFLDPMTVFHGWSREEFALALAVQNLLWGVFQPFAGALADRHGSGKVLAVGLVVFAVGVAAMAFADTTLLFMLAAGILVGLSLALTSFGLVLAAFAKALPAERRSWAFGVGTAAGSLGQFLIVPLGQGFITAFGWLDALLLLAGCLLMVLPLTYFLQPVADRAVGTNSAPAPVPARASLTQMGALRGALADRSYVLLTTGFFVCGFHVAFIAVHMPAFLTDSGFAPSLGAISIATIGLFNVIGAYTSGVLGGRYSKKNMLCVIYLGRSVVIAAFITLPMTEVSVLVFSALMGLLWLSTIPPTNGIVGQLFGVRNIAMLFGVVFFGHQLGAFLGVWLGGWLFDTTGSYEVVWWLSVALGVAAAIVHWPIRETASSLARPVAAGA